MKVFIALLLVAASSVAMTDAALSCLDMSGNEVDWWFIMKLPDNGTTGLSYAYYDPNSSGLSVQGTLLDGPGAMMSTMTSLYEASADSTAWIMYNDQPPDEGPGSDTYAHAKGVVAFDSGSGFWLSHSVPMFPDKKTGTSTKYSYPDSGTRYGQSFLCQTYGWDSFETLAQQQNINRVNTYDSNLPSFAASGAPTWKQVIEREETSTTNGVVALTSLGGFAFTNFAKGKDWDSDLYSKLVAPKLGENLICETWMRGKMPDYCGTPYHVSNVQTLSLNGENWKETQDHAKWCVGEETSNDWMCVGDINRMCSQRNRGGGTTCFQQPTLKAAVRNIIQTYDQSCGSNVQSAPVDVDKDGVPHRYRSRLVTPANAEPLADICDDSLEVARK